MAVGDISKTEMLVLSALASREMYGLEIATCVGELSGGARKIPLGSLYVTLHRMEDKGLVKSRMGEATEERRGARRRYYAISAAGDKALRTDVRTLTRILKLEPALRSGGI